jgi:hypothetical protein
MFLNGWDSISGRGRDFSVSYQVRAGSEAHSASYTIGTRGYFPGVQLMSAELSTHFNIYLHSPIRYYGNVLELRRGQYKTLHHFNIIH